MTFLSHSLSSDLAQKGKERFQPTVIIGRARRARHTRLASRLASGLEERTSGNRGGDAPERDIIKLRRGFSPVDLGVPRHGSSKKTVLRLR